MGYVGSIHIVREKKRKIIPQDTVFVPPTRVPVQSDVLKLMGGGVSKDLASRMSSIRNQIVLVAQDTGGSAIRELQRALEEYLPLLVGLLKKEHDLQELVEFKWKNLEDGREEVCIANSWFELLSTVHMMALLTLMEANSMMIAKDNIHSCERVVSSDSMRIAVDLLLKAAGFLEFLVRDILVLLPHDIRNRLPKDLHEGILEATAIQALGQGTEMQLSLAVESQNASLSVKRRLACEQLSYYGQAHFCLSTCDNSNGYRKKHLLFIKWKYIEAKAAAYYYHGLMLDKGTEPSCQISAVCCFLGAEELLAESKKACLSFCLADPVTRAPSPWGVMKYLNKKIPETGSKKSQMYGYLLDQEKDLQILPDLPEFQLSLKPEDYKLPEVDSAWEKEKWDTPGQTIKDHLKDSDDEMETI